MTVTLEPMSAERYESWHHQQIVGYAEQKTQAGIWTQEDAVRRATADTAAMLTDGRHTAGHDIFVGTVDGEEVGFLWLYRDEKSTGQEVFVYDIEVAEAHRGRGLGRELLDAGERWCVEHGIATIRLNVFSFNTTAINLYESSGFVPTSMTMMKRIAAS